jgi:citrate lyase subunit beta/citryl-CoA lyase
MRSKLFVPATRPEFFAKALAGAADAISFDLEDAVVAARKAEARETLKTFLRSAEFLQHKAHKIIIVRVNAMDTPYFADDIKAVAQSGVDMINLPKPASAENVRTAAAALAKAEHENGVSTPIKLLLNIETPSALQSATQLAQADARVVGLQLGLGDLFEPLEINRREAVAVQQAMFTLRVAAGAADNPNLFVYDGAFANVQDIDGFRAEAQLARNLGYAGKTCIHPSQVAIANEVFSPSEKAIAEAQAVLNAAQQASVQVGEI